MEKYTSFTDQWSSAVNFAIRYYFWIARWHFMEIQVYVILFIFKCKFIYFNWRLITLQYCIGFAIHQHESTTDMHMFPILNPPPSSHPIPSLWVVPVHQPQAPNIIHRTRTGDSFHIWYYTCFNAILPNHSPPPSPTESKRLFYVYQYVFCCLVYRVTVTIFLNSIYMR